MRALLILILLAVGCGRGAKVVQLPAPPVEVPAANLPVGLRPWNWTDAKGSGSCVIASSVYHLRWQHKLALADGFRKSYAGGQTADSIKRIWSVNRIPFVFTEAGDPSFLEWASETRRGAIIWYFPSHCVHFCGFSSRNGQEFALLNDNNRVQNYIWIPKQEFLKNWRGYGGFAASALFSPVGPLLYPGYEVRR